MILFYFIAGSIFQMIHFRDQNTVAEIKGRILTNYCGSGAQALRDDIELYPPDSLPDARPYDDHVRLQDGDEVEVAIGLRGGVPPGMSSFFEDDEGPVVHIRANRDYFSMPLTEDTTASDVLRHIQRTAGQARCYWISTYMREDANLVENGVTNGSTIHVVQRTETLPGGAKRKRFRPAKATSLTRNQRTATRLVGNNTGAADDTDDNDNPPEPKWRSNRNQLAGQQARDLDQQSSGAQSSTFREPPPPLSPPGRKGQQPPGKPPPDYVRSTEQDERDSEDEAAQLSYVNQLEREIRRKDYQLRQARVYIEEVCKRHQQDLQQGKGEGTHITPKETEFILEQLRGNLQIPDGSAYPDITPEEAANKGEPPTGKVEPAYPDGQPAGFLPIEIDGHIVLIHCGRGLWQLTNKFCKSKHSGLTLRHTPRYDDKMRRSAAWDTILFGVPSWNKGWLLMYRKWTDVKPDLPAASASAGAEDPDASDRPSQPPEGTIALHYIFLEKAYTVHADLDDTIDKLKNKIIAKHSDDHRILPDNLMVYFNNELVHDHDVIDDKARSHKNEHVYISKIHVAVRLDDGNWLNNADRPGFARRTKAQKDSHSAPTRDSKRVARAASDRSVDYILITTSDHRRRKIRLENDTTLADIIKEMALPIDEVCCHYRGRRLRNQDNLRQAGMRDGDGLELSARARGGTRAQANITTISGRCVRLDIDAEEVEPNLSRWPCSRQLVMNLVKHGCDAWSLSHDSAEIRRRQITDLGIPGVPLPDNAENFCSGCGSNDNYIGPPFTPFHDDHAWRTDCFIYEEAHIGCGQCNCPLKVVIICTSSYAMLPSMGNQHLHGANHGTINVIGATVLRAKDFCKLAYVASHLQAEEVIDSSTTTLPRFIIIATLLDPVFGMNRFGTRYAGPAQVNIYKRIIQLNAKLSNDIDDDRERGDTDVFDRYNAIFVDFTEVADAAEAGVQSLQSRQVVIQILEDVLVLTLNRLEQAFAETITTATLPLSFVGQRLRAGLIPNVRFDLYGSSGSNVDPTIYRINIRMLHGKPIQIDVQSNYPIDAVREIINARISANADMRSAYADDRTLSAGHPYMPYYRLTHNGRICDDRLHRTLHELGIVNGATLTMRSGGPGGAPDCDPTDDDDNHYANTPGASSHDHERHHSSPGMDDSGIDDQSQHKRNDYTDRSIVAYTIYVLGAFLACWIVTSWIFGCCWALASALRNALLHALNGNIDAVCNPLTLIFEVVWYLCGLANPGDLLALDVVLLIARTGIYSEHWTDSTLVLGCCWALTAIMRNQLMHALNGNIELKEATVKINHALQSTWPDLSYDEYKLNLWLAEEWDKMQSSVMRLNVHNYNGHRLANFIKQKASKMGCFPRKGKINKNKTRTPWHLLVPDGCFVIDGTDDAPVLGAKENLVVEAAGLFLITEQELLVHEALASKNPLALLVPMTMHKCQTSFPALTPDRVQQVHFTATDPQDGQPEPKQGVLIQMGTGKICYKPQKPSKIAFTILEQDALPLDVVLQIPKGRFTPSNADTFGKLVDDPSTVIKTFLESFDVTYETMSKPRLVNDRRDKNCKFMECFLRLARGQAIKLVEVVSGKEGIYAKYAQQENMPHQKTAAESLHIERCKNGTGIDTVSEFVKKHAGLVKGLWVSADAIFIRSTQTVRSQLRKTMQAETLTSTPYTDHNAGLEGKRTFILQNAPSVSFGDITDKLHEWGWEVMVRHSWPNKRFGTYNYKINADDPPPQLSLVLADGQGEIVIKEEVRQVQTQIWTQWGNGLAKKTEQPSKTTTARRLWETSEADPFATSSPWDRLQATTPPAKKQRNAPPTKTHNEWAAWNNNAAPSTPSSSSAARPTPSSAASTADTTTIAALEEKLMGKMHNIVNESHGKLEQKINKIAEDAKETKTGLEAGQERLIGDNKSISDMLRKMMAKLNLEGEIPDVNLVGVDGE